MKLLRYTFPLTIIIFLVIPGVSVAQDVNDTIANRRLAAREYLEVQPIEEMTQAMAAKMAAQMPSKKQAEVTRLIISQFRLDVLRAAALDAMVDHFTLREIEAMTQFYATPEGQSIMEKMDEYMADLQPAVMIEVQRAMRITMKSLKNRRPGP